MGWDWLAVRGERGRLAVVISLQAVKGRRSNLQRKVVRGSGIVGDVGSLGRRVLCGQCNRRPPRRKPRRRYKQQHQALFADLHQYQDQAHRSKEQKRVGLKIMSAAKEMIPRPDVLCEGNCDQYSGSQQQQKPARIGVQVSRLPKLEEVWRALAGRLLHRAPLWVVYLFWTVGSRARGKLMRPNLRRDSTAARIVRQKWSVRAQARARE